MFAYLLQLTLVQQPSSLIDQFLESPYFIPVLISFAGFVVLLVLFFIFLRFLRAYYQLPVAFKKVILLVTLPKESAKKEEGKIPSLQEIQEDISVAETLFSAIGGLYPQKGLRAFFMGREDHLSFEIVADKGLISFYVGVPLYMQRFVEQQIQAQFPNANIDEVEDYNIFNPEGIISGSYLVFKRTYCFPIKTYLKLESDPINALTNALSKLKPEDGAAIQYVIRSSESKWHKLGIKIASEMQQGKKLGQAIITARRGIFMKTIGEIFDLLKTEKKEIGGAPKEPYKLSPLEEEMVKGLEGKASKAGLDVNIRIIVSSSTEEKAKMYLDNIINSFGQYNIYEFGNSFVTERPRSKEKIIRDFIYRNFDEKYQVLLNTEEMASVFHFPLPTTETPNIKWLIAKKAAAPVNVPKEGLSLGYNVYRGEETVIKIKRADRRRHMYIIGKSGTGKSNFISNLAAQDIKNNEGVCVIDPHGDLVEDILYTIPKERVDDVIIFNPSDVERPMGLNMLEYKTEDQMDFAVQEMISIFYKLFPPEMIGPMFEHNMRNVMLTLMADKEYPGTIADIPRMFTDKEFQMFKLKKVKDPVVRSFWEKEMAQTSDFHKSEMLGYLISKVGRFVENEMMRNIIGQPKSGFDFRDVMDNQKVLLVNLAKGKTGDVNSNLLGLIIVSKLQMAAMSRADMPQEKRKDFYLYIDEFQNFITDSIGIILSEARKYMLDLTIAHQYIGQLVQNNDTKIRDAVFGNAGTMVCFKIGVDDAETMAKEFAPIFNEYDVINIEQYTAYVKLLIDNTAARPFNMRTYPFKRDNTSEIVDAIKELSRLKYGRDRRIVEAEILERTQLGTAAKKAVMPETEPTL